MNTSTTLGDLATDTYCAIGDREYRVLRHWSTGVEVAQLASWGAAERTVMAADTVVEVI